MPQNPKIMRGDLDEAVAGRTVFTCCQGYVYDVLRVYKIPGTDKRVLLVCRCRDDKHFLITWFGGVIDFKRECPFLDLNHPKARVQTP